MKANLRNAHISLLIGAVVLFGGVYLFRHADEDVLPLVGLVCWIVAFGTFSLLSARDDRRRRRDQ